MVRGWPSDHWRPGFKLIVTVNVLPLITTPPLATVGMEAARSGMYFPSVEIVRSARNTGDVTSFDVLPE